MRTCEVEYSTHVRHIHSNSWKSEEEKMRHDRILELKNQTMRGKLG